MKKFFFFTVALASSMFAQAQKIVSFGFEDADKGNYHCQYALTARPDGLGDWVNVHEAEGDNWIEQSADAAHSGSYGLQVLNSDEGTANSWDRGFKLSNLPVKENVPYRVSFWIKGPEGGKLSSWLSVGVENFDKSFCTAGGSNYGLDQITLNGDGEWQRVSFVSVYHGKEAIKTVIDGQSWVGNAVFPEEFGGDGTVTYKEHFGGYIPETFFFIANMNSAGEYMLDDIVIEENVAVNAVTFNGDVVKIDFGYPTNIASLAKANEGSFSLNKSCVTITSNGEPVEVELVEGKEDGYLYAFLPDGVYFDDDAQVSVTFAPAADCPIVYSDAQKLPGVAQGSAVLGFQNEASYYDGTIDAISSAWSEPELVSTTPENESFEMPNDFGQIIFTYNKELSLDYASATLSQNGKGEDWTDKMTLSEDGLSVIVNFGSIQDGEYTLTLSGVANIMGVECQNDQSITFSVGIDNDDTESEDIYCPDWSSLANGTFPVGWVSNDNGTIHQYGLTDNGEVWNYNWGGNVGGGGCRSMTGYSGDFNGGAMYWRSMNGDNQLGTLTYGEQVNDYLDASGNVDPDMDPEIALYLEPKKYQISFKMAAWKFLGDNAPHYNFELTDLAGNVYAQFLDYEAKPNVNGAQNMKVEGATSNVADFVVTEPGYYVLRFSTTQANAELLMGNLRLITMPSKAAYYKQQLNAVIADATALVDEAFAGEGYEGSTLNALDNEIQYASSASFHTPSDVNAEIENLHALMDALKARIANIDIYNSSIDDVKVALEEVAGTKYENVDVVAETAAIVAKYGNTSASELSDSELAEVAPIIASAAGKLNNVQSCTDALTWGIYKAVQTAETLESENYDLIDAAGNAVSDDRELAKALNNYNKLLLYKKIADGTWNASETTTNAEGEEVKSYLYLSATPAYEMENVDDVQAVAKVQKEDVVGVEMTGYVANPKMYRVNGNDGLPGWSVENVDEDGKNLTIGWGGTAPNASQYVTDQFINIYGDGNYKVEQTIEGLPVGVYTVVMATRTPLVDKLGQEGFDRIYYYNGQNDDTQVWDKYIYANAGDSEGVAPYLGLGSYYGSHSGEYNTVIRNIVVREGESLTIGATEHYVSGKAVKHEDDTAQSSWTGTCMVDDVHIYFTAPLEGYDYKAAATQIEETAIDAVMPNAAVAEIYNVNGVRLANAQKGINIVKMSNGKVVKVLVK